MTSAHPPVLRPITADDPEARSADLVAENVERLRALFPEAFLGGGGIDFPVLKQLLGGAVDEREEKYGLTWHGKRQARQLALTPSTGTLLPCPEESVDWDTTRNLIIEGDNLEVLKLLQKSYAGKVKLIYIDPPYNTGKDFVYKDDYRDNLRNYLEQTKQVDAEGRRTSSNTEASGRFHTDWLNMMYPRLKLGWTLLRQDGFLVASIDDKELANLRVLLNEICGEENFVAVLVFDRNRKNDAKLFSVGHEYMVVYARNKALLAEKNVRLRTKKEGVEEVREEFERLRSLHNDDWDLIAKGLKEYYATFEDDDPRLPLTRYTKVDARGPYRTDGNPSWPGGGGPKYKVPHPVTGRPCKIPSRGWVWPTYERMQEEIAKGNIVFGADETTIPGVRTTLFENSEQVMRSVIFSYAQKASQDFAALFDGVKVFDNPKSYLDLAQLIEYLTHPGDLVVDFFAGSGTTAHGVLLANRRQAHEPRRFICIQLPEAITSDSEAGRNALALGYRTIFDLARDRIRQAVSRIRLEIQGEYDDHGFRVFKLATSNIRAWEPNHDTLEDSLLDHADHLAPGRTEQDVLYELLLKLGLDLAVPIEQRTIAGKTVHSVGGGVLLVCLAEQVARDEVEPLALGIAGWHAELAPAGEAQVVVRDSAFADDVAKTNLVAILQQHGLENVRSL